MRIELTNHNINRVAAALKDIEGKEVLVNDIKITGARSVEFEETKMYFDDPDESSDDFERIIEITFNMNDGSKVSKSFRPDLEHCEISFETDELWVFHIEDIDKYVAREKHLLEFKLKNYEEYIKG